MIRIIILVAVIVFGWKLVTGRWPWEKRENTRAQAIFRARKLLGVSAKASHSEVVEAHRSLITMIHPDRGGTNAQVHEANDARDLLLAELPHETPKDPE